MAVTFRLRGANKNLYVRAHQGDIKLERRLKGFSLLHYKWSQKKQRITSGGRETLKLNEELNKLKSEIEKALIKVGFNKEVLDNNWLQKKIEEVYAPVDKKADDVIVKYCERFIEEADLSLERKKDYNSWLNNWKRFQEEYKGTIQFSELNHTLMRSYRTWSLNEENSWSPSYIAKQVSTLKTLCRKAREEGIKVNPFFEAIKTPTIKKREENIVVLSWEEIGRIEALENLPPYLERVRLWFYLGISIGQRGNDLLNITTENVIKEEGRTYVELIQSKTKKSVTAEVWYDKALETIERLEELTEQRDRISLQKFNTYFKELCKRAEITEPTKGYITQNKRRVLKEVPKYELCSSHLMRRVFSTLAYHGGVAPHIIMDITQHGDISTFMGYIGVNESRIDRAKNFGDKMRQVKYNN